MDVLCSPTNVQNADELLVARTPFDSRLYNRSVSGVTVSSPTSSSSIVSSLLPSLRQLTSPFVNL